MLTLLLFLACGTPYSEVQKMDTIEAYEAWIAENAGSPQMTLAEIRLEELYLEKAREEKTLEAYDDYLSRYGEKGGELVNKATIEREEFLFDWAGDENTIDGWEKYIAEYPNAGYMPHEVRRPRKLLLQKTELKKLEKRLKDVGVTVVPVKMFIAQSGYAKVNIAVAKGKKLHDKRASLKDKDQARDLDRLS